jgi:hypothetical protein
MLSFSSARLVPAALPAALLALCLTGCGGEGPNAEVCRQSTNLIKWVAGTRSSYGAVPEVRVTQLNAVGQRITPLAAKAEGEVKSALLELATTMSDAQVDGQTAFTLREHALDGVEAQIILQSRRLASACD